jgi:NCAIR mutase (PurE)-related protein
MKRAIIFAFVLLAAVAPVGGAYSPVIAALADVPVQAP